MRAMKDSGIAWIGEIPEKWNLRKIKYIFRISSGTTPKSDNLEYWDGDIPWVTPADYKTENEYIYHGRKFLSKAGLEAANLQLLPVNSIVLSKRAPIGAVAITAAELTINQGCIAGIPIDDCSVRYYYFILSICTEQLNLLGSGTTFKELSAQDFGNFIVPTPDVAVQERIADYLDRKCSQIDSIIARQQEVIEKLKAYKLSVITETVTKGLNPHAPMKDSGVEWIGEIPEQWETASISRVATVVRGASPRPAGDPRYFNGQDVPWITVAEVTKDDGKYIFSTESYLTKEGAECSRLVEKGTLLLSNSGATLGVPKVTLITGCINDGSVAFLDLNIEQMYLLYVFKSRTLELRKQMQGYGQPNLNTTIVKNIVVPLPHPDEQKSISEYLDKRCKAIDDTIEMKEKVVERLSKYKKSLIYEVVTGKEEV